MRARRFHATVAGRQEVTMYHADTVDARQFLRARCADVIVADAPSHYRQRVIFMTSGRGGERRCPLVAL